MYRRTELLLRPTRKQEVALGRLLAHQRQIYNAALQERIGAWTWERRSVSLLDQQKHLTGWHQEFGVWVARGTLARLDRAFRGFFRRTAAGQKPGFPRYRGPSRWDSIEYPGHGGGWRAAGGHSGRLYLQGVGCIAYRTSRRGVRGTPKTLVVKREGRRWRAFIACELDTPAKYPLSGRSIGIDLGVTELLATSDGELVPNPRWLGTAADRLVTAERSVISKKRGSNRRRKAADRVATAHRKIRNQRRDAHHKISRRLVDSCDLIVHEALQIDNMTRRPKPRPNDDGTFAPNGAAAKSGLNREISSAGWGILLRLIAYKAEEAGREVIAIDPRNTSRRCHECGHVDVANRSGIAFQCQKCGHQAHADINAAKNILRAGLAQRLGDVA